MKNETQQGDAAMRGTKWVMLLCAAGALLVSGCMSARVTTNLQPKADAELRSSAGRFYVAGLKYANANPQVDRKQLADFEQRVLPHLRKECSTRYPALFADDASGAIPLGVEVRNKTTMHNGETMAWMYGTVLLCGLIFPAPGTTDEDFDVTAGVWNGRDGAHATTVRTSFRRENHVWVSLLTPSALITIPGKSDFPKVSGTLFGIQQQMDLYYQQIAPQIATALAQPVAAKEPEYWAAPASRDSIPGSQQSVPPALPPPAEQPAPF
jgi:hypothetical protein